jgi:hypothetical protein
MDDSRVLQLATPPEGLVLGTLADYNTMIRRLAALAAVSGRTLVAPLLQVGCRPPAPTLTVRKG